MDRRGPIARAGLTAVIAAAALSACAPIPVDRAERECVADARAAQAPRGHVSVGVASDGRSVRPVAGLAISVSSDYLGGRDPSEVFNRCVVRRSGQMPTRPLISQPGWTG